MKVEVIYRSEEQSERYDYRGAVEIRIDGKKVFKVSDGEPEDSNLSRDFSDVYSVPALLAKAYQAGLDGETFEITKVDSDDI